MTFHLEGTVILPCDRCLDHMKQPIETNNRLTVKLGKEYTEESDEVLVVSEDEGGVNLAWFLYEFVALAVPMKHVHAPGECNRTMAAKLRKHTAPTMRTRLTMKRTNPTPTQRTLRSTHDGTLSSN